MQNHLRQNNVLRLANYRTLQSCGEIAEGTDATAEISVPSQQKVLENNIPPSCPSVCKDQGLDGNKEMTTC